MADKLQIKICKCYIKWLCKINCKNRTCKTKGYCSNQSRYDKIKEKIEIMGKEK